MEKVVAEKTKIKNPKEKILQTLKKVLTDQPLNEEDKSYIARVKKLINCRGMGIYCDEYIYGDKYILKSDLNECGLAIVSELELPREIIVFDTKNSEDGVMCTCACKCKDGLCTREIQQKTIDLVYKKQ